MVVAVLAGGAGTRLWPASRPDRPKPLLRLAGSETLLASTAARFAGLGPLLVVVGEAQADAIRWALPDARLLLERTASGTGPAVALAARAVDRDELVLVSPADHAVARPEALLDAIRRATPAAEAGRIVTFGVTPTSAATGYGWIRPGATLDRGVQAIDRFVEKPGAVEAAALLASGHLWNAGLFLFRAGTLLDELDRLGVADAPGAFDVLVMERTDRGAVIAVDCGWSDLGTWETVLASGSAGPVSLTESPGTSGWSDGPAIAVFGVPGVRVVASAGGVLVCREGLAERVGTGAPPPASILDHGPGWAVERRALAAGDAVELGPDDHATIVTGDRRGERATGRFVADAATVLVVVRIVSRGAGSAAG